MSHESGIYADRKNDRKKVKGGDQYAVKMIKRRPKLKGMSTWIRKNKNIERIPLSQEKSGPRTSTEAGKKRRSRGYPREGIRRLGTL